MPDPVSYSYALIRVVPRVERGECVNCGVILYCPEQPFLGARIMVDEARLRNLDPSLDLDLVRRHLEDVPRICNGDAAAGDIARLPLGERFHWLVAPKSAIIQTSEVHPGLCTDPERTLRRLFETLIVTPGED
jgi:hypothetical protein